MIDAAGAHSGTSPAVWMKFLMSTVPEPQRTEIFNYCHIEQNKKEFTHMELVSLILRAISVTNDLTYGHCKTKITTEMFEFELAVTQTAENLEQAMELSSKFSTNFIPSKKCGIIENRETAIFFLELDGIDDEHAGAVETALMHHYIFTFSALIGAPINVIKFLTRSKLLVSITDRNLFADSAIYNSYTGIEIDKKYLKMPNISQNSSDLWAETMRWQLLFDKLKPIFRVRDEPIVASEKLLGKIESITKKRNVDLRQKRRISYEETGYNLRDLQNAKKIADSIILLCATNLTISKIAEQMEFSDLRSFHRFFYEYTALTPSSYRKKHGEHYRSALGNIFDSTMKIADDIFPSTRALQDRGGPKGS